MSETVYLLGAGINRGITDWHGLKPPLAGDLFQQLLQSDKYSSEHYQEKIQSLLTYINDYWKLSNEDLLNQSFDIEACFTLIQMQKAEAELESKRECYLKLSKIEMQLTSLLAEFLNEFSHFTHNSDSFQELGRIIFKEKPTVITFNYDTLLEEAIESASGLQDVRPNSLTLDPTEEITEDELCYSHFNWNRPLAYGMKFDEVELHRAGVSQYVEGELFYSQEENKIYDWNLLKLHGSLNWFTYSGIQKHQLPGRQFESKKGKTIICNASYWFNELPDINNEILSPLIITPVLYKELMKNVLIFDIWKQAKNSLTNCNRLVIGGYSFPPTDFYTKRLFYEAFKNHSPEEIIVINPDTSVVRTIKELCHYSKPVVVCKNLDEFINRVKN